MQGVSRKLFPGGNTSQGSYPLFDNIIPKNVNRIFCLKGGPGVGKSSMMKKVAKEFLSKGYDVELHFCTSDPSSLDAIVISKLGVVMLDGTAPHIVDPKLPGAIDEIVNLGEYWNVDEIEKNRNEIASCNSEISSAFRRGYKFLEAAKPIYKDIEEKYSQNMDFGKINLLTEKIISELLDEVVNSGEYKKERHLFGTAITPVGHVDYADSMLASAEKVYYLDGEIGTGKTTLLTKLYTKAVEKGLDVEVFHYPLIPTKLETVYIKDLKVGITTSKLFSDNESINLNQFIIEESLNVYDKEIKEDQELLNQLINSAIDSIKTAKDKHDVIEAYYIPNMDFDRIEKLKDELVERMLKYEK